MGRIPLPNLKPVEPEWDVLCYDTETSGTDVKHGQVLQFSGIRADSTLSACQTFDRRSLRLPYVVPEVGAVRVTGYDLGETRNRDLLDEYDFARLVTDFMVPKGGRARVFMTFNGVKYDDHILRTLFHRNLLDPYVTTEAGCTRVDVLNLVRFAHAMVGPDPVRTAVSPETGRQSWKLEHLAKANGIQINAHDGLADGFATMRLAHVIKRRAPLAWNVAFKCGNKVEVGHRLRQAYDREEPVWLFTHYGRPELVPCLLLGPRGKRWLAADLRRNPDWIDVDDDLRSLSYGRAASLRVIAENETPYLFGTEDLPTFKEMPDVAEARTNAVMWSCANVLRRELLGRFGEDVVTLPEAPTSEERIYGGFAPWSDKRLAKAFHAATWEERAAMEFQDDRMSDFAARIVLRNVPDLAPDRAAVLRSRCAEALVRPHAPATSRFATLAREWPLADGEWRDWACDTFGYVPEPVETVAPAFA